MFVISHILFAIVWLVGSYYHVYLLEEKQYLPWIWAAVAFWAFDRTVRIGRLVWINVNWSGKRPTNTDVTLYNDSIIKMSIPVADGWNLAPGSYVFLYFPSFKVWQSHPFTIVDISKSSAVRYVEKSGVTVQEDSLSSEDADRMTILFRAHKGVTKQILKKAIASGGHFQTRVLVEGPYGSSHDLTRYDTVVLLAAGLGITACMSPLMQSIRKAQSTTHETSIDRQRIVMHWVVREESSLAWMQNEIEEVLRHGNHVDQGTVDITLHVSGTKEGNNLINGVKIEHGRPTVKDLINNEVAKTKENARVAVLSCGPGEFSDDARSAVVEVLGSGTSRSVTYYEEAFNW